MWSNFHNPLKQESDTQFEANTKKIFDISVRSSLILLKEVLFQSDQNFVTFLLKHFRWKVIILIKGKRLKQKNRFKQLNEI